MSQQNLGLITATASVITACGVIFFYWQVRILRRSLAADHERSRREKAIEVMAGWFAQRNGSLAAIAAMNVVERLDEPKCRLLWNKDPVSLDAAVRPFAEEFLAISGHGAAEIQSEGTLTLNSRQSAALKSYVVDERNALEIVATAWRHHVCDRTISEAEVLNVVFVQHNRARLEVFRRTSGIYPSLAALIEHMGRSTGNKPPLPTR